MVTFNQIPSNLGVPFMHVEFDRTPAADGGNDLVGPALIIAHRLSTGSVAEGVPTLVSSASQAADYFGAGSMAHHMADVFLRNNPSKELWVIALNEAAAGTAATKTITFTGPASADGTLYLYVAGRLVEVTVTDGDTAIEIATATAAAINALGSRLPCTASSTDEVVTVTYRHKGTAGNGLDVRVNYLGPAGGEVLPSGVGVTIAAGATGATDPDFSTATDAMSDDLYDYIVLGWSTAAGITAFDDEVERRAGYGVELYGCVFGCVADTAANLVTFTSTRNSPFETILGIASPLNPPYEIAAAYAAQASLSADAMPSRGWDTLPLEGILPPARADRFTLAQRNTLLLAGVATTVYQGAALRIACEATTYQTDTLGQADDTYRDPQKAITAWRAARRWKSRLSGKFARYVVVDDGTPVSEGVPAVSPVEIRGEILAEYTTMVGEGWMERIPQFSAALVVERNADNRRRVDMLLKPYVANPLRVLATRLQPQ